MMTTTKINRKPSHDVLHVKGEGKGAYWTKIDQRCPENPTLTIVALALRQAASIRDMMAKG